MHCTLNSQREQRHGTVNIQANPMKIISRQGDTLDALCWRHYGRTDGTVEAALQANPGLADLGVVLPMGTVVELPEPAAIFSTRPLVQLFD
jgi:phage tail protein X